MPRIRGQANGRRWRSWGLASGQLHLQESAWNNYWEPWRAPAAVEMKTGSAALWPALRKLPLGSGRRTAATGRPLGINGQQQAPRACLVGDRPRLLSIFSR
ncbi:hypothetical protein P4H71_28275 [Paenibacillus kribbensis]|uniref:hypothetical protein n=1 Tax=Paenibacillus kribbensis TaxID=172713 RepID=UPI002DBFA860|nr:hypothetical protein [Paenibacillus kribbensis]MEC0238215.1 hypothetical protein [Paenibacillus kribbensis]